MGIEYRVIWKRVACRVKRKRYASRRIAERFLALLTTKEPWTLLPGYARKGPDDLACCSGRECGCLGRTVREHFAEQYADMPPLEWARIEQREVGNWHVETLVARSKNGNYASEIK